MKHILSTFVLSSLSALANTAPLPNLSYTGNNRFIQLNSYIAPAAEGGGQFAGTVAYQNQSISVSSRWECLDFSSLYLAETAQDPNEVDAGEALKD